MLYYRHGISLLDQSFEIHFNDWLNADCFFFFCNVLDGLGLDDSSHRTRSLDLHVAYLTGHM